MGLLVVPVAGAGLTILLHVLALVGGLFAFSIYGSDVALSTPPGFLIVAARDAPLASPWGLLVPIGQCLAPLILAGLIVASPNPFRDARGAPWAVVVLLAVSSIAPQFAAPPVDHSGDSSTDAFAAAVNEQDFSRLIPRYNEAENRSRVLPAPPIGALAELEIGRKQETLMLVQADGNVNGTRVVWPGGEALLGDRLHHWSSQGENASLYEAEITLSRAPWYVYDGGSEPEPPRSGDTMVLYRAVHPLHLVKGSLASLVGLVVAAPVIPWWRQLDA